MANRKQAPKRKKRTIGLSMDDESMAVIRDHQARHPLLETPSAALRHILKLFKEKEAARG